LAARYGPKQGWNMESGRKARAGLAVFLPALIIGSALLEYGIPPLRNRFSAHFVLIYMWWVAASSILARLVRRESFRDLSFCWGGRAGTRAVLVGAVFPVVVGFTAYGISWQTGLTQFSPSGIPPVLFGVTLAGSSFARFLKFLLLSLTAGSLWACKSAAGEELGWRGYMLRRLIDSRFPAPVFMSGLIWALWHLPLIFCGQYPSVPHTLLSVCVFLADIISAGYVLAWLRLSSGSIWPCVWAHAVWNAVILGPFDGSTVSSGVWLGEAGILSTAVVILFAAALHVLWPLSPRKYLSPPLSGSSNTLSWPAGPPTVL